MALFTSFFKGVISQLLEGTWWGDDKVLPLLIC